MKEDSFFLKIGIKPLYKQCPSCKKEFEISSENWFFRKSGVPYAYCKHGCHRFKNRIQYEQLSPEQYRSKLDRDNAWKRDNRTSEIQRQYDLKRHYGLTVDEYETLYNHQGGVCVLCENPPGKRALAVDHCHLTGQVRGLLCSNCNNGLGLFKDDPKLLQKAIKYLEKN